MNNQAMNKINVLVTVAAVIMAGQVFADTHYVSLSGSHEPPFTSWETASTDIQSAVDAAVDGDTVLVTDGTYNIDAQIYITNGITVQSVNGAADTTVNRSASGSSTPKHRIFYLDHSDVVVDGFTITNGYSPGNTLGTTGSGGGVFLKGGTVKNCVITKCNAKYGGGLWIKSGGTVSNCIITKNYDRAHGGGVYIYKSGTVKDSTISGNAGYPGYYGGGVYCYWGGLVRNCLITKNRQGSSGGVMLHGGGTVESCTISRNTATYENGYGGGGVWGTGGTIKNSIIYLNTAPPGLEDNWAGSVITYSYTCTTPAVGGTGNIMNDPQFISATSGDYHPRPDSPCIDAGINQSWMTNATDLDGNSRILNGIVDMGVYETPVATALQAVPGIDGGGVATDFRIGVYESQVSDYLEFLNSAESAGLIAVDNGQVNNASTANLYCLTKTANSDAVVDYNAQSLLGERFTAESTMLAHPIVFVSWFGAAAFCNWRSTEDGLEPVYDPANGWTADLNKSGYRLPTETEWYKSAAWYENQQKFYDYGISADNVYSTDANYLNSGDDYETNAVRTCPIGSFSPPSPYGLKDASGNVWEWCHGFYDEEGSDPDVDPHAVRGGSWGNLATDIKTTSRCGFKPGQVLNSVGFRVITISSP